jgi:hypothetical protein
LFIVDDSSIKLTSFHPTAELMKLNPTGNRGLAIILSLLLIFGFGSSVPAASADTVTTTIMSDTTASYGLSLYSGRQIHTEVVTSSSVLVGKEIHSITLKLRKVGLPSGTSSVGVFDENRNVKKLFGTLSVSSLTGTYKDYVFYLGESISGYVIKSGDMIGIKYSGGSSQNTVSVMTDSDPAGPFDGKNTFHAYYTTSWRNYREYDLNMQLTNTKTSTGSDGTNGKPVLIHFDDNRSSQWSNGKPILDKYDIKGTFYVICGRVGTGHT